MMRILIKVSSLFGVLSLVAAYISLYVIGVSLTYGPASIIFFDLVIAAIALVCLGLAAAGRDRWLAFSLLGFLVLTSAGLQKEGTQIGTIFSFGLVLSLVSIYKLNMSSKVSTDYSRRFADRGGSYEHSE